MFRALDSLARRTPEALALLAAPRENAPLTELSWAALQQQVTQRAAALRDRDPLRVRPIVARSTAATVVEILAGLKARRPHLLLPTRRSEAQDTALRAPIVETPLSPGSDAALLIPTSGSSGTPRGVILSMAALRAAIHASAAHLGDHPDDRFLGVLPLSHLGGLSGLLRAVAAGRPLLLLPERPEKKRKASASGALAGGSAGGSAGAFAPAFITGVETFRATLCSLVPALLRRLLDEAPTFRAPEHLRAILVGGAASDPALLEAACARALPVLPTYGLTETCGQVCTVPAGTPPHPEFGVGRPLPGLELRLDDGGRIAVRGPTLFSGYHPASKTSPLDQAGWFQTRDLGHIDSAGRLHLLGRADAVIITGGENVHPDPIEAALLALAGVDDAGVVGLPDPVYGARVAAAVVLLPGSSLQRVEALARARLQGAERPRSLVALPELPRTESGKLDRPSLRRLIEAALLSEQT